ncbi:hypothetical protein HY490_05275, partial [Candidatus Woesearchaeota archaeon]|nr:hypothetical protein [Candidatus Woesearchaeota archaeon]
VTAFATTAFTKARISGQATVDEGFFNGSIDEVRFYNRTLSAEEIAAIYNNSKPRYDRIVPQETGAAGENWTAVAVPIDSQGLNGTQTFSNNLTIAAAANTAPTAPVLISPANSTTIQNRTQQYVWNNSVDADGDNVTYNLQVDNDSDFISPELNISTINQTNENITNFTSVIELEVDRQYFWRVNGFDGTEFGAFSKTFNFTLESELIIALPQVNVSFGTLAHNSSANTTNDTIKPFVAENRGNIVFNVTITGTKMFINDTFPTNAYQFQVDNNESNSFNVTNSTNVFTNMTNASTRVDIRGLDWHDINDTARIDILLNLPHDEPAGLRNSTVMFTAST